MDGSCGVGGVVERTEGRPSEGVVREEGVSGDERALGEETTVMGME